jgi:nucleotide-binding universal stress UspA family protein
MYKKILVPLDGSALAECAFNHLKSLIKDEALAEITLLTVVRVDISWGRDADINAIREKVFYSSGKYLAGAESRLKAEGMKVKAEVVEAESTAHAIIDYAREKGVDIIVMATHGHTGMKGVMWGSVAFGVAQQSHIPVLLIRPESCRA